MTIKLVILDRDNTLVRLPIGRRYLYDTDPMVLMPSVSKAISYLNHLDIFVVVATNQQGICLEEFPKMTSASVDLYNQRLNDYLKEKGAYIDRFYICPHCESDDCSCRKPKPGLFLQALRDYGVSSSEAIAIGNSQRDMDAARAAGIKMIAVPYPRGTTIQANIPCYSTLLQAVRSIYQSVEKSKS